jgi:hypothetical protein
LQAASGKWQNTTQGDPLITAGGTGPNGYLLVSGVFPPSCSERHSSENANQLMASVRIYGRPYS